MKKESSLGTWIFVLQTWQELLQNCAARSQGRERKVARNNIKSVLEIYSRIKDLTPAEFDQMDKTALIATANKIETEVNGHTLIENLEKGMFAFLAN